jgi:hypothetical protein
LINSLEGDRCNTPLETIDEWVVELRKEQLPKALKRPLTNEELK